ncbi:MAG: acyl-ACP--UDP-N-acetylglucosamine O-acyltransferase [Cyanobacteria bacterium]|nr:acyl-ACP--UDP-N-acetylglucosamine O-acyltransferase [Cyanobacteriota bacterium]MDW8201710.1 acyl-ACP--UDP-N-acetylglucosamine O-acyltransferase [Cyanobacteriota bacterium SKYGB_h_bin112]
MTIHPTAVIEPGAQLGENVTVGAYSVIDRDVQLGDGCAIGSHVSILGHTILGAGCRVHAGAVIGDLPQDLAYTGGVSYVRIGNNTVIREGVTIHRGTKPDSVTTIGDGCLLMVNSHVGHNATVGNQVIITNGALLAGYVQVGDRTVISGNCLIHQHTRIGRLAMLCGSTATQRDVPPFCMTRSFTNTVISLNVVGLRRAGFTPAQRLEVKRAFDTLYRSGLSVAEAVSKLEQNPESELTLEFCNFIKSSKRICKFYFQTRKATDEDDADEV